MIPLKRRLSLAFGLVVLATVAVLITTGTVGASPSLTSINAAPPTPSIPVNVTNTPLAVTGTVNANLVGTPTVNANIAGTVNANLTNSSFTVGNPATNPVLVRDVDNGANFPYMVGGCYSETGNGGCLHGEGYDQLTVPTTTESGQPVKALAIDFVSGTCFSVPGGEILAAALSLRPPPGVGPFASYFVPTVTYSDSGSIWYAFAEHAGIYAPAGTVMLVRANYRVAYSSTAPPPFRCDMNINGHFITQ